MYILQSCPENSSTSTAIINVDSGNPVVVLCLNNSLNSLSFIVISIGGANSIIIHVTII